MVGADRGDGRKQGDEELKVVVVVMVTDRGTENIGSPCLFLDFPSRFI